MPRLPIAAAAVAALLAGTAHAHISLKQTTAVAGATWEAVLVVGHGCDGAATTAVRVQIPEGVVAVRPRPHPGWELETVLAPSAQAQAAGAETLATGVREIVWSGGSLPDAWYDEFAFRARMPEAEPGTIVYFPIVQECGTTVHRWIEIPAEGEDPESLAEPAPGVTLVEGEVVRDH